MFRRGQGRLTRQEAIAALRRPRPVFVEAERMISESCQGNDRRCFLKQRAGV
jgi:hypothetical protein